MEAVSKIPYRQQPLHLSIDNHRSSFSRPSLPISLRTPSSSSWSPSPTLLSIRASSPSPSSSRSSSSNPFRQNPKTLEPPFFETLLKPFLKTTAIAIAAAALVLARSAAPKPVLACPPAMIESFKESTKEKELEEYLVSNPEDVNALRSLMEVKLKTQKLNDAIDILDRLVILEPEEREWPMLRAHTLIYNGDTETGKMGFEEILAKDPLSVEAYNGLVIAASQSESPANLNDVMKRAEEAMSRCKEENKKDRVRDFKLLLAQINVVEGNYDEALRIYEELVKEEPRDFRPYLCQGIIYTLLRKQDEAEKQFQKYRRLVPKGHPYADFFNENMIATKIFSQMPDNQGAVSSRSRR